MTQIMDTWAYIYGPMAVFMVGVYGLLTRKNMIKAAVSLNIMDLGVNIFIVSLGYVPGGKVPIYTGGTASNTGFVDPLPQAMVLTAIVISVAVTAFILALTVKIHEKHGMSDMSGVGGLS